MRKNLLSIPPEKEKEAPAKGTSECSRVANGGTIPSGNCNMAIIFSYLQSFVKAL
jgi:hypothetical protein